MKEWHFPIQMFILRNKYSYDWKREELHTFAFLLDSIFYF